jgi:predicted RNase H-like HicB family nuclease
MTTVKFVYWQDSDFWIGHFQNYPDYLTQGATLDELKENLQDLYKDLTSGEIPGIRRVDELVVA